MKKTLTVLTGLGIIAALLLSFVAINATMKNTDAVRELQAKSQTFDLANERLTKNFYNLNAKISISDVNKNLMSKIDLTGQSFSSSSFHGVSIILYCKEIDNHATGSLLKIIGANSSSLHLANISFDLEYGSKSEKKYSINKKISENLNPGGFFNFNAILPDVYPEDLANVSISNLKLSIMLPAGKE